MKKHTVTVVNLTTLSTRQFKVTHYRASQTRAWAKDEFGTRYAWPFSEFAVRQH